MAWRKWVVRSLVFAVTGALGAAVFAYQHWTSPAMVRQLVIARLSEHLIGATINLESAHLKLLGGIAFTELRLARRDDPSKVDVVYVPSGAILHDKEQLVSGKLVIRKIEWYRPRLRIIRREDGSWNLEDLLAPPDLDVPVPTIEFQNATIQIEDRYAGRALPTLEINNVKITIINDPAPLILQFKGTGQTDLAGAVHIDGLWDRKSKEISLSLHLPNFPVNGALVQRLAASHPELAAHARQLSATGRLDAQFQYRPQLERPWTHDIRLQLKQGKLTHAELPLPLENLEAKVRCKDGEVTLEDLKAQAGSAQVRLDGKAVSMSSETDFNAHLNIKHLHFTPELIARMPEAIRDIQRDYRPKGDFTLKLDLQRHSGQWREHCIIQPERMSCECAKFPYLLEQVTGFIDHESDPGALPRPVEHFKVKLEGYSGKRPVHVEGTIDGTRRAGVDMRIWGEDIPLDEKLCAALEPKFQEIVHSFGPTGLADIEAHIYRQQGADSFANRYSIRFHDTSLRYDVFPYLIENVTGTLDIQPDHWEFRNFRGTRNGGEFYSQGGSTKSGAGSHLTVEITGKKILLDAELEAALVKQPPLKSTWRKISPSGRMDFVAHVDLLPGQTRPEITVAVTPLGATIHPEFFPCDLTDIRGAIEYGHNEARLRDLQARHGQTFFTLKEGKIHLNNGDVSVDLVNLTGHYILLDAEMRQALPPTLAKACASLQLKDPVSVRTDMSISVPGDRGPPYIYWDGGIRFKDATLHAGLKLDHVSGLVFCRGQHQGNFGKVTGNIQLDEATILQQPFRNIHSHIFVGEEEPGVLQLPDLKARVFDGDLGGAVRLEFAGTPRYDVNLQASQIKLEEFGQHNRLNPDAKLEGLAAARVYLHGQGTDLSGVEGEGSFDVPTGKMYNLPLLLALLKFLNLRSPDRTAFDEAHVRYAIHGPRLEITRLDLLGNAISIGGKGTVNLESNDIDMDLYAVWARVVQVSPPLIKELWPALGKSLLKIKMKGRIGQEPHFEKKLIPGLVEPLQDLMRGSPRSAQGG